MVEEKQEGGVFCPPPPRYDRVKYPKDVSLFGGFLQELIREGGLIDIGVYFKS